MKSLMLLLDEVLIELGTWCRTSTILDRKTIKERFEHEGLSFLTITLPTFTRDFEQALEQKYADRHLFLSFSKRGELPRFLGGFLDLVFDRESGLLLSDPDIDAIFSIRQITLMFGKMNLPCTDARVSSAMSKFVECEQDVRRFDMGRSDLDKVTFKRMSNLLWANTLQKLDEIICYGELVPQHGPGSTAEKLFGNKKFQQMEWTERLEYLFPHGEYLIPNWRYFPDLADVSLLEPDRERPVRVISVPKTQKTPRVIAIEPTCMMYVQQAIMLPLVQLIEGDDNPFNQFVGFTNQVPNQEMAREGSLFRKLATLDLSEASDRVSYQLVREMTAQFPHVAEGFDACRSRNADVPGHGIIPLSKFASMGSALCFPVEAMVFLTIIFLGIERELNRSLTLRDVHRYLGKVRVYGDDIIVPVEFVHSVIETLESYGLLVNSGKSFWTGKFRESCGKEFYDGRDVSVTRVRRSLPTSRKHVKEIISTVSLRNQLYKSGMWKTCAWLDEYLRKLIPFPTVLPTSPVLGRHSYLGYHAQKECPHLHRPIVKGYVVRSVIPPDHLEGYGALLKVFLKRGDEPFADSEHLERAGRPDAVDIKLRWASAT